MKNYDQTSLNSAVFGLRLLDFNTLVSRLHIVKDFNNVCSLRAASSSILAPHPFRKANHPTKPEKIQSILI